MARLINTTNTSILNKYTTITARINRLNKVSRTVFEQEELNNLEKELKRTKVQMMLRRIEVPNDQY